MASEVAAPAQARVRVLDGVPARRVRTVLLTLLLVVIVAELLVRLGESRLPVPLRWQSPEADTKVRQMDALRRSGGADVVFVGSSVVNAGIDPRLLTADSSLGSPSVYNAALTAAVPTLTEVWTTKVVFPRVRPRVLVIGLTSFDFTDSSAAPVFFRAFADSRGGRRLVDGDALNRVDGWFDDHSALWRHKFDLRDPKAVFDALRGRRRSVQQDLVERIQGDGRTVYRGFGEFNARREGGPPIANWSAGKTEPAALTRLIRGSQAAGVTVVLVDMPVTDEYVERHPDGADDYGEYLGRLRGVAARTGARLVELGSVRDHALFADIVHLNSKGAASLTSMVAAALRSGGVLPLPRTESK